MNCRSSPSYNLPGIQVTSIYIKKYSLLIISILVMILSFTLYFLKFNGGFSNNQNDWGSFGSYIGGLVGSSFSFINIILLTITLKMQIESNTENRREKNIKNMAIQIDQYLELLSATINETQFAFDFNKMEEKLKGGSTIKFVIDNYFENDSTNRIYIIENILIILDKLKKIDEESFNFNLNKLEIKYGEIVKKYLILAINSIYHKNKILFKKYLFWYISVDPEILILNCRKTLRNLLTQSNPDGNYENVEWK